MKLSITRHQAIVIFGLCHLLASVIWLGQARAFPRINPPELPSQHIDILYRGQTLDQLHGNFPGFLVRIKNQRTDGNVGSCTGTLIARDLVLTAAHCLKQARSISIEYIKSQKPLQYGKISVSRWKAHDAYSADEINLQKETTDIALLALAKPVPKNVRPAIFAPLKFDPSKQKVDPENGLESRMFILGRHRKSNLTYTDQFAFVPVFRALRGNAAIHQAKIRSERGWCVGDSGGPVTQLSLVDGEQIHALVGVAYRSNAMFDFSDDDVIQRTWSDENPPACGRNAFYTPIAPYLIWIGESLGELFDDGHETRDLVILPDQN